MSWYLRREDGTVYGPAALREFRLWAADGRIAPTDQVSQDQESWRAASEVLELALDWYIEDEERIHGPFHALLIAELVATGQLPGAARVRRRETGHATTAAEAVVVPLFEERMAMRRALAAAADGTATDALATAEARLRELEHERAVAAGPSAATAEVERLLQELREAESNRRRVEQECAERLRLADQASERNVLEAKLLRDKLDDAHRRHLDLLAAYRELNDRFIRLRGQLNEIDAEPAPDERPRIRLI